MLLRLMKYEQLIRFHVTAAPYIGEDCLLTGHELKIQFVVPMTLQ